MLLSVQSFAFFSFLAFGYSLLLASHTLARMQLLLGVRARLWQAWMDIHGGWRSGLVGEFNGVIGGVGSVLLGCFFVSFFIGQSWFCRVINRVFCFIHIFCLLTNVNVSSICVCVVSFFVLFVLFFS